MKSTAQSHANDAKREAQGIMDQARSNIEETKQDMKGQARNMKSTVREGVEHVREEALETGRRYADRGRTRVGGEIGVISSALRRASDRLYEENDEALGNYIGVAADRVDSLASYFNDRPLEEILDDVSRFAHRNPAAVVGGMFAAGLLMGRFFRSSESRRRPSYGSSYYGGYEPSSVGSYGGAGSYGGGNPDVYGVYEGSDMGASASYSGGAYGSQGQTGSRYASVPPSEYSSATGYGAAGYSGVPGYGEDMPDTGTSQTSGGTNLSEEK